VDARPGCGEPLDGPADKARLDPLCRLPARARRDEIAAARLPDAAHSELDQLQQTSTNGDDAGIAGITGTTDEWPVRRLRPGSAPVPPTSALSASDAPCFHSAVRAAAIIA
jgi:hypothetical protein